MFDLTGKKALVTGATGGLGSEIARRLHAAGASVALSGTREEKLKSLADELGERVEITP
ncbi:MAG: SDR family NAD(P)-dependent oxidoreductase, partial [Oceanicaulis sp.]